MKRGFVTLCAWLLAATSCVFAQGTEPQVLYNRLGELLRHPTFITLRVAVVQDFGEKYTDTPGPYRPNDSITLQIFITQNYSEPFSIWSSAGYENDYRLELIRDGEIVPYLKDTQQRVERANRELANGSGASFTFEPGREYRWIQISLLNWYEPLKPGHYQLTVRRRFVWGGDWLPSNPITFEVQALETPEPIPENVVLRLAPSDLQPVDGRRYVLTRDGWVRVFVVNNSNSRVKVKLIDEYYANRPQLYKGDVLIPYRQETAKLIRAKEEDPRLIHTVPGFYVEPNTMEGLQAIKLSDWYGPLAPGSYRLINRRRFEIGGPWTADSVPMLFEISSN